MNNVAAEELSFKLNDSPSSNSCVFGHFCFCQEWLLAPAQEEIHIPYLIAQSLGYHYSKVLLMARLVTTLVYSNISAISHNSETDG